jgi:hypothetical protein
MVGMAARSFLGYGNRNHDHCQPDRHANPKPVPVFPILIMTERQYLHLLLSILLAFLVPVLVLLGLAYAYLKAANEVGPAEAVSMQRAGEFCLYGSGLNQDFYPYKRLLYRESPAEVVALGSSRVMQFREKYFRSSFVNLGGMVQTARALDEAAREILSGPLPKTLILGIDFWWFNPRYQPNVSASKEPARWNLLNLAYLKTPWTWVWEGKLKASDLVSIPFRPHPPSCRIGTLATHHDSGFGPDGSYYYAAEVSGLRPRDRLFKDTLWRIETGTNRFEWGEIPEAARIESVVQSIGRLKAAGIQVIAYLPPLAPQIHEVLQASPEKYAYIQKSVQQLSARGIKIINLLDGADMGASNCEFVDGFHPGEIASARILASLSQEEPELLALIDLPGIRQVMEQYAGMAMVPDSRVTRNQEVDFLGIGCDKQPRAQAQIR